MAVAKADQGPDAESLARVSNAVAAAKRAFEACAFWKVKSFSTHVHIKEIRSQFECQVVLIEEFVGSDVDLEVVGGQSLELFHQSRSVLKRCGDIASELQNMRRSNKVATSPGSALTSLSVLGSLERPATDALEGLVWSQRLMEKLSEARIGENDANGDLDEWDSTFAANDELPSVQQLVDTRVGLRHCLLRAVREARAVSANLVANSPAVHRGMICSPHMLQGVEALALREASLEIDPGVNFALGMHHSELAIALREESTSITPSAVFFGEPEIVQGSRDHEGLKVTSLVHAAEDLFLLGEQASSGASKSERRLLRAKRLVQHAYGVFATLGFHDSAASRVKEASAIFASLGETRLAAQTLSEMAEHHLATGDHEASLASAGEALALDDSEPVALYLQATLRRSLGELRTEEDVHLARKQLGQVAGRLPGKELESRRALAHAEMIGWAAVAEAGTLARCFELHDVALVLICAMCRLAYA
jgi:tetratricopeptide (TPR) repeat protein